MLVDRTETQPLLLIRIIDDAGEPISGITHDDEELSVALFAHLGTAWSTLTLTAGTVGTYAANTIVEMGAGIYQLCLASAAITPGGVTQIRVVYGANDPLYDAIVARGGVAIDAIISGVVAGLVTPLQTFAGNVNLSGVREIVVVQRDDYSAADGRAFEWIETRPSIDFTDAMAVLSGAGGGENGAGDQRVTGTVSLHDRADGSCRVRLEFTSTQLNVPADRYDFDIHFTVSGRRVTNTQITLLVQKKRADLPS